MSFFYHSKVFSFLFNLFTCFHLIVLSSTLSSSSFLSSFFSSKINHVIYSIFCQSIWKSIKKSIKFFFSKKLKTHLCFSQQIETNLINLINQLNSISWSLSYFLFWLVTFENDMSIHSNVQHSMSPPSSH